jgi:hypothetical protein
MKRGNAVLAVLNGLMEGINAGLKERRENSAREAKLKLEQEELGYKREDMAYKREEASRKAEIDAEERESKQEYYGILKEGARLKNERLRKGLPVDEEMGELKKQELKSRISSQGVNREDKIYDDIKALDKEISSTGEDRDNAYRSMKMFEGKSPKLYDPAKREYDRLESEYTRLVDRRSALEERVKTKPKEKGYPVEVQQKKAALKPEHERFLTNIRSAADEDSVRSALKAASTIPDENAKRAILEEAKARIRKLRTGQ